MVGQKYLGSNFVFSEWQYLGYSPKKDMFLAVCVGVMEGEEDPMTFQENKKFLVIAIKTSNPAEGAKRVAFVESGDAHRRWKYINHNTSIIDVFTIKDLRKDTRVLTF
jgi:hypothetical protein